MSNPNQTRHRYQLATSPKLNYVRFALVLFIGTFIVASITNQKAFEKCMKVYSNSDICYKLN